MTKPSSRILVINDEHLVLREFVKGLNAAARTLDNPLGISFVGVNTAKDLLHNRLQVAEPGPGYVHLSTGLADEFYSELVAEVRVQQKVAGGTVTRWVKPNSSVRNERLDTAVLALFGAHRMKLHQYTDAEWRRLELMLCPPTADLFSPPAPEPLPAPEAVTVAEAAAPAMQPQALWSTPRRRRVLSTGVE